MNKLKALAYAGIGYASVGLSGIKALAQSTAGETFFGNNNISSDVVGESGDLAEAVQGYIGTAMTFLSILVVVFAIYGGFLIMTAGGEDEKVGKGKKILLQGVIGLIVIFLAGSIVKFVMGTLLG